MKEKLLEGKGEMDYDYLNDILFFKIADREYSRSIEVNNIVLDIDEEGFIVGIQIFDASLFLKIPKTVLRNVPKWQFMTSIRNNRVEIRLVFQVVYRSRIIEKSPIIIQDLKEQLPNSEMICTVP